MKHLLLSALRSPLSAMAALLSGSMAAVVFFWLLSCTAEKEHSPGPKQMTQAEATDRILPDCECEYRIVSFETKYSTDYPDATIELKTPYDFCEEGNQCPLFFGWHTGSGLCQPSDACRDNFSGSFPSAWRDFNCLVPNYSSFDVTQAIQLLNPSSCAHTNPQSWELKYQIRCLDYLEELGCQANPQNMVWVYSPVVTKTNVVANDPFGGMVTFDMEGCGCTPIPNGITQ